MDLFRPRITHKDLIRPNCSYLDLFEFIQTYLDLFAAYEGYIMLKTWHGPCCQNWEMQLISCLPTNHPSGEFSQIFFVCFCCDAAMEEFNPNLILTKVKQDTKEIERLVYHFRNTQSLKNCKNSLMHSVSWLVC